MSRKVKKTTLVANAKQYAVMNTMQEKECQELQKAIEYINARHKKAHVHDGTPTEDDGRSPGISWRRSS